MSLRPSSLPATARDAVRWAVAAALLLGVLSTLQSIVALRASGRNDPAIRVFLGQMPPWLLWASFTPVIWWIVSLPGSRTRVAAVARHLVAAIVLVLAHSALLYAWQRGLALTDLDTPIWRGAIAVSYWRLAMDLVVYGALCSLIVALRASASARRHELNAMRLGAQLQDARLRELRARVHPHFLFNALNTIAMAVRQSDGPKAIRVVTALGDLLREMLREPRQPLVPLREEMAMVERYLAIERARFGEALRVTIDVAPDALDALLPTLAAQHLVENALRHGIGGRAGAGHLRIGAWRDGTMLRLEVEDDGPGITVPDEAPRDYGAGLKNLREQLETLYGGRFDFTLRNGGVGAVAALTIPVSP